MLANAKENEQRSKERNMQLMDKLERVERKLADTHVDMTHLRDAQRQYLKYVESCLPAWRNKVRQYNETAAAGRQGSVCDTDTAKSEIGMHTSLLLTSPPATARNRLSGPGMAGHQLLLPFPAITNVTKQAPAEGRLQDLQSDITDIKHHLHTFSESRPEFRTSNVQKLQESAAAGNGTDNTVSHEETVASQFVCGEFSQSMAAGMPSTQPVFHSTTIMDRHQSAVHSPPSLLTLNVSREQRGDLSVSSVSDDKSLSEGEIPTVDQCDAQRSSPSRQAVMPLLEQHSPTLSIQSSLPTVDQDRSEQMSPLQLSELQPTDKESAAPPSGTSNVKLSHDMEISMSVCGSKVTEDADIQGDNTSEDAVKGMETRGQDREVDESRREELRSFSISSVSSISLSEPAVDEASGESETTQSAIAKPPDETHCDQLSQSSQHSHPREESLCNSVSRSSIHDELNDALSDGLELGKSPVVDVSHLQQLFGAIERDVAVGMEVNDLYCNKDCSEGMKKRIRETLDTGGDLERFGANGLTVIVLEVIKSLCAGDAGPLMPVVLLKKHTPMCKTESQFRAALAPHWVLCWEMLTSHLQVLVRKRALQPRAAATVFAEVFVPHSVTNREKQERAVQILSMVLEDACQSSKIASSGSPNFTHPSGHGISHKVKSSHSDVSLSLAGDLGETDNPSERPEHSVRLSETDAYKLLLAGSKSDHLDDDAAFSVSEDSEVAALENDLGSVPTLEAERESSGFVHSVAASISEPVNKSNKDDLEILSDSKSSVSQLMLSSRVSPALRLRSESDRPISRTSISYLQDSDPESDLAEEVWPGKTQTDKHTESDGFDQDDFDFYD